jgi:hypothetical protein
MTKLSDYYVVCMWWFFDSYPIYLDFHNGLPYLKCPPQTKDRHVSLRAILISDVDWDPKPYNSDAGLDGLHLRNLDYHGSYLYCTVANHTEHDEAMFFEDL